MSKLKKFSKLISAGTKVMLNTEYGYREVERVCNTCRIIKVSGVEDLLEPGDICTFTNMADVEMYPAADDLYVADQYGSVYERAEDANIFIGKLNGRTLKQFVAEL